MIELQRDEIAEKLDELADLAIVWERYRSKGRNPTAVRAALATAAHEITLLTMQRNEIRQQQVDDTADSESGEDDTN